MQKILAEVIVNELDIILEAEQYFTILFDLIEYMEILFIIKFLTSISEIMCPIL